MRQISDGQVEVAMLAYWSSASWHGSESRKPMRAALEAYERVRDAGTDNPISRAVRRAGSDCLEEFVRPGGLTNSADYVAEAVFSAMQKTKEGQAK